MIKSITRNLILFKKPRNMTNDFLKQLNIRPHVPVDIMRAFNKDTITVNVAMAA